MIPVGHRISPDAARSLHIVRVHDLSVPGNLSRVSWKLSRTVLRGGTRRKVGPLLDSRRGTVKQPFCFEVRDGELFALAGLWERWRNPKGDWIRSCSILTTAPNAVTSQVHDRMPVILDKSDYELWLDPGFTDVAALAHMLKPYDASNMRFYPVSSRINQVSNDDPVCALPTEIVEEQNRLF